LQYCAYFGFIEAGQKSDNFLGSTLIVRTSGFYDNFFIWNLQEDCKAIGYRDGFEGQADWSGAYDPV